MKRVGTHRRPDMDALASAWLAERHLFAGEPVEVVFLPRSFRPGRRLDLDCVVDIGNAHDPGRLLFDHKPPAFLDRHETCAARLVWQHLLGLGRPLAHLADFIDAVHDGDSVRRRGASPAYRRSRESGAHAPSTTARAKAPDALALSRLMRDWLDGSEQHPPGRPAGRLDVCPQLPAFPASFA